MVLFDRYIAVDWSAKNEPTTKARAGADSIWLGDASRSNDGAVLAESTNPRTRHDAMSEITSRLGAALRDQQRVLMGFDFPFGYPVRAAEHIAGKADWKSLWAWLFDRVTDSDRNVSNRFQVASDINAAVANFGPLYWGHPQGHSYTGLAPTRVGLNYSVVGEKRIVERRENAKSVWQLSGAGSVGGQAITGIARLERLLRESGLRDQVEIWPFETDFERKLHRPIVICEIYPSMFAVDPSVRPLDRAQVEAVAHGFAELDQLGKLGEFLSSPKDLAPADRDTVLREEGWIVGSGHDALRRSLSLPPRRASPPKTTRYLRDPAAIYDESFATIRREADLLALPGALHTAAIRMIHACGMVDLAGNIVGDPAITAAVPAALAAGATVFCDAEMVRAGLIRRLLPASTEIVVTLSAPETDALAARLGTTRSAAAVEFWRDRLEGSVVVIGNAPTALFHLLDLIAAGAPRPAAIIGIPVGFVGAAESKARLEAEAAGIPFLTVRGRRGGSAIAAAAFNALAGTPQ